MARQSTVLYGSTILSSVLSGLVKISLSRLILLIGVLGILSGCVTNTAPGSIGPVKGPVGSIKPHFKVGNPYQIGGQWYYPQIDKSYREIGVASWYGPNFHGKPTANGELFDSQAMTAAHRTLPLPVIAEVKNLENGRTIRVRVNDRGPFAKDRIIDLSKEAANRLGFLKNGTARVEVRYVREADLDLALVRLNDRRAMRALEKELGQSRQAAQRSLRDRGNGVGANNSAPTRAPEDLSDLIAESVFTTGEGASQLAVPSSGAPFASNPVPPVQTTNPQAAIIPQQAATPVRRVQEQFQIQVAAFSDLNRAERVSLDLSRSGSVFMQSISKPQGGTLYKVLMGPYGDQGQANQQLGLLQQAGYRDAWIIQTTSW